MKYFLTLIICLHFLFSFSKTNNVNVYIIIDNFSISKSDCKNWAESIYLESKLNISSFKIYSHTNQEAFFPDSWTNSKKNKIANFYSTKIDCDYNPCIQLKSFIQEFGSSKSKLYIGEGFFKCDLRSFGLENGYFKNSYEDIKLKIEEEILINKNLDKDLSLFFYVPPTNSMEKPTIAFASDTITIKRGEVVDLSPDFSENCSLIWEPNEDINCLNCKQIKVSPSKSSTYFVKALNENNCYSELAKINIEVKKGCEDNFEPCRINYLSDKHLYRQTLEDNNKWLMSSSQPGSEIYYLICSKNCADNITVNLYDNNRSKVWSRVYRREDVESGNKLHFDYPDNFIFKVNLNNINNFDKNNYYYFEIISKNEDNNNFKPYVSPLTKFVECGL